MAVNQISVAARAADIMQAYADAGTSQASDPDEIAKWLRYAGDATPTDPFCISGVCWCLGKSWLIEKGIGFTPDTLLDVMLSYKAEIAADLFTPSPSCTAVIDALGARFTPASQIGTDTSPPHGSVNFFQFSPTDRHAEFLESKAGNTLNDVGANVGCHVVADRTRDDGTLLGMWIPNGL